MLKKPKTVSSAEQLQSHLEKSGGQAKGIHWETEVERDDEGEIVMEMESPVMGTYSLADTPEGISPLVEFKAKGPETIPLLVREEDVMQGAVQVIARRLK